MLLSEAALPPELPWPAVGLPPRYPLFPLAPPPEPPDLPSASEIWRPRPPPPPPTAVTAPNLESPPSTPCADAELPPAPPAPTVTETAAPGSVATPLAAVLPPPPPPPPEPPPPPATTCTSTDVTPLGTVHVHEPVPLNVVTSYVDPATLTVDVLEVQAADAGGEAASGMSAIPAIIAIAATGRSNVSARRKIGDRRRSTGFTPGAYPRSVASLGRFQPRSAYF